jgi:hypothetical protein
MFGVTMIEMDLPDRNGSAGPRRAPPRRLAVLAALVLAAHALVLEVAPFGLSVARGPETATHAFTTRRIEAAPAPARVAQAAPPPKPKAAPRPAAAKPAASPAPAAATPAEPAAQPTAPAEPEAPAPPPTGEPPGVAYTPGTDVELGKVVDPRDLPQAQAYAIPESVRMKYEVVAERFGITLRSSAELLWRHDGRSYEAVMEAGGGMFPRRTQRSTGLLTADGLAPLRFADKSRTETATHFVREREAIVFSNNKPEAPLVRGVQDRLSIVVQLAAMVGGAPQRYPKGATITVPTASTSEVENWVFTVEGDEELELPMGRMPGLKLQRMPRREHDTKVELWLAPGMDYAPVRLRLTTPNGDSVDQRWSGADRP